MTVGYLAHSAKDDCPAQSYAAHITGVWNRVARYAAEAERFGKYPGHLLRLAKQSALRHDLGKLDDANQAVLHGNVHRRSLPVNHVDAGCAAMMAEENLYAALLIFSHHKGLPNLAEQGNRMELMFRDEETASRKHTDQTFAELLKRHRACVSDLVPPELIEAYPGEQSVFLRMALSCLADADHTDTAAAYKQAPEQEQMPPLRAEERLAALDRYVSVLGGDDARSALRRQMYAACRDAKITDGFAACDSPVGSGKTTAVMAHLLRQAVRRKSRRIFVILPYTSIIQQSVDVYRKALVLPGEDPAKVVAELHCRADFEDMDTRYLTALWRAPIVVTTAVAFFETMASNRPSALRRLHELPGSVVFVDEAHNALPIDLLPLAWGWMNALAEEWGCYWVLASGSLVRYWALPRLMAFRIPQPNVCELVPEHLRAELMQYETGRIRFQWEPEPLSRQALCQRVQASLGPRLLILNTVQSAAVFASDLCDAYGREAVEHLSTALTAADRAAASERIKKRLQDQTDTDWTLVATSCVEAGVDFSFRTGFREVSSLLSLLQAAGRVNRHGTESEAEMWSFRLKDDSMLRPNKALHIEQEVLQRYFMKRMEITPELSTGFLNDVLAQDGSCLQKISSLLQEEENLEFADIEEKFKVIEENTVLAVVDEALAKRILFGKADWTELQKNSVSVRKSNIRAWNLKEIGDGLYQWTLRYDPFLGYMCGVLDMERAKHGFLNC